MNHPDGIQNGDYIAVDLDANNHVSRAAYAERHGREAPSFGWGVCRHGHGLQSFGDGLMPEHIAKARAIALNAGRMASDVVNR